MVNLYNGKKVTPMELLMSTSLWYLGRGWTCDNLEEATVNNSENIWILLYEFVEAINNWISL